jgi:hypothetical protein
VFDFLVINYGKSLHARVKIIESVTFDLKKHPPEKSSLTIFLCGFIGFKVSMSKKFKFKGPQK